VWPKCLSSDVFSVWEQLSGDKIDLLVEVRPHIYTWYCRIKRNMKDHCKSSERPLGDLQGSLNVPKGLYDSMWVILTHIKLFLAVLWAQSWARGWVAVRTCSEQSTFHIWKVSWNWVRLQFRMVLWPHLG